MKNILYLFVSLYNKENDMDNICLKINKQYEKMIMDETISKDSRIVLINNGSNDNTLSKIKSIDNNNYLYLNTLKYDLEDSLLIGLYEFVNNYDLAIAIDADCINKLDINKLFKEYNSNYDIIYETKRVNNKFKLNYIWGFTNYYLVTNRVVKYLQNNKDINTNLAELLPLLSFRQKNIVNDDVYKTNIFEIWSLLLNKNDKIFKIVTLLSFINVILSIISFITSFVMLFIFNISIIYILFSFIWFLLSINLLSFSIISNNCKKNKLINYYVLDNSKENSIL